MATPTEFSHNARSFEELVAQNPGVSEEMPNDDAEDQVDDETGEEMAEEEPDEEESTEDEEQVEEPAPKKSKSRTPSEDDLNKLRSTKDKEIAAERKRAEQLEASNKQLQQTLAENFKRQAEFERMSFEWSIAGDPPDVQQQKRLAFQAQQRENLMQAQLAAKDMQIKNMLDSLAPMAKEQVLKLISEQTGVPIEKLMQYDDPKIAEEAAKIHAEYAKTQKAVKRVAKKADVFEGGGGAAKPTDILAKYKGTGDFQGYLRELSKQRRR